MMSDQDCRWGLAYRNGELVCGRVEVIVERGNDDRIGLAPLDIIVHDVHGEHRLTGRLQPPTHRIGPLDAINFRLREQGRVTG